MSEKNCENCKHRGKRCYCSPSVSCGGYAENLLTEKEFVQKYCHNCGSQRCEGIGTEWFEGCKFKDQLMR